MNMQEITARGVLGMFATGAGLAASLQDWEAGLRVASLVVGLAVGIVTLVLLLRGKKP
jgi:hypothetical protein